MIGSLSFLPAFLFDWGYRLIAKNRHRFFLSRMRDPVSDAKGPLFELAVNAPRSNLEIGLKGHNITVQPDMKRDVIDLKK